MGASIRGRPAAGGCAFSGPYTDDMATIPIAVPPGDLPADLADAVESLRKAGHEVVLVRDEDQERQHDPFRDMEPDAIPETLLRQMGLSREELKRHRDAPPALEHGRHHAAHTQDSGRRRKAG